MKRSFSQELNKAYLSEKEYEELGRKKLMRSNSVTTQTSTSPRSVEYTDQILIIRGFQCYLFNPKTYKFRRVADSMRDRSYFGIVFANGMVYAISTFSMIAAGSVECYDVTSNKWTTVPPLPVKLRSIGATVTKDDNLVITGGIDLENLEKLDTIYIAQVDSKGLIKGNWVLSPLKLLHKRYRHAAATSPEGLIYIAGGIITRPQDKEDAFTSSVEIYDPSTHTISMGPSMNIHRAIDVHLFFIDRVLYAVGGDVMMPTFDSTGNHPKGSIERLNLTTNTWEIVTQFPQPRHGISVSAIGHIIYIFGGHVVYPDDVEVSTWDAYDINTEQWFSWSTHHKERIIPFDCLYGSACVVPNLPSY